MALAIGPVPVFADAWPVLVLVGARPVPELVAEWLAAVRPVGVALATPSAAFPFWCCNPPNIKSPWMQAKLPVGMCFRCAIGPC